MQPSIISKTRVMTTNAPPSTIPVMERLVLMPVDGAPVGGTGGMVSGGGSSENRISKDLIIRWFPKLGMYSTMLRSFLT